MGTLSTRQPPVAAAPRGTLAAAWRALAPAGLLTVVLAAVPPPARADAVPAAVFGDHMVLQRGRPIRVWGTARPGERVRVALAGRQARTRTAADGRWAVSLRPLPAGGPHRLEVAGEGAPRRLEDVLVGDLWLCAGQSNMEWPLAETEGAADAIADAAGATVRHLRVPHRATLEPQADMPAAAWQVATPATAGRVSGVAWHFARRVQRETGVAIGLIDVSWGGSAIEPWLSRAAALADPAVAAVARVMPPDDAAHRRAAQAHDERLIRQWQPGLAPWDGAGAADGQDPRLDDAGWPALQVPGVWESQGLAGFDGSLWLRRWVELSAVQAAGAARLHLGTIDDCDRSFVNGREVGQTCGWLEPRVYELPPGMLHAGRNLVAVRVHDSGGDGGFHGDPAALRLETADGTLPLAGRWAARIEAPLARRGPRFNDWPALIFNGMVQPLVHLPLRGVLWYQGESNVGRAAAYAGSFRRLIGDWRRQWQDPRLPFLFVQLSTHVPPAANRPEGSAWAELRDAQRQALALPATGMAVAFDVGDPGDMHPRDKRSVGERLARLALARVHGRALAAAGPRLLGTRVQAGGRVELRFAVEAGGMLATRPAGAPLLGFMVADASRRFVPAQAEIRGRWVQVWSPQVARPLAVRYGWADNPAQANLVDSAGLPASPLRTDRWPLLTEGARLAPPWP